MGAELVQSRSLFTRVSRRLRAAALARDFSTALVLLAAAYLSLLLVSRLLGLWPGVIDGRGLPWLPAVAVVAAVIGWFARRGVSPAEAARAIDRHAGSKDLFLTAALLEKTPAEFGALVARDAETRAPGVVPSKVVPFAPGRRVAWMAGAVGVVWLASAFVPQFDPFGKVQAATQDLQRRDKLVKARQVTLLRSAELKREQAEGKQAKQVQQALKKLEHDYRKLKPKARPLNMQRLNDQQKLVGEMWRKLSSEKLGEFLKQRPTSQEFGGATLQKSKKWTEDLKAGDTAGLKKEIDRLQDELRKLAKNKDPAARAQKAQELRKELKELSQFASNSLNAKSLQAALDRAMSECEACSQGKFSDEGLQAALDALDLAQLELKQVGQSAKDLQALEQALRTLQMAKRLCDGECLDGGQCQGCKGLGDYEALFKKLCQGQGMGAGDGPGMGGPGRGRGGKAPEDESQKTAFQPERSPAGIQAGKTLLTLKTKGEGEKGQVKKEYKSLVRDVKQGASEAVLQEQIPPGYHEGIKKYFDALDRQAKDEAE